MRPGEGASTRNGGIASGNLRPTFQQMIDRLGPERAQAIQTETRFARGPARVHPRGEDRMRIPDDGPLHGSVCANHHRHDAALRKSDAHADPARLHVRRNAQTPLHYRPSPDDRRILFGGRGASLDEDPAGVTRRLQQATSDVFPELDGVEITHSWSGYVAMNRYMIPRIFSHDELHYAAGYCGSGVEWAAGPAKGGPPNARPRGGAIGAQLPAAATDPALQWRTVVHTGVLRVERIAGSSGPPRRLPAALDRMLYQPGRRSSSAPLCKPAADSSDIAAERDSTALAQAQEPLRTDGRPRDLQRFWVRPHVLKAA
jgi:hypothetical protein